MHSTTVKNCFAWGDVTGKSDCGGLIGHDYGSYSNTVKTSISNCYSRGKVVADTSLGGLIGYEAEGIVTNCYFDSSITGLAAPANRARTTTQMWDRQTFAGWDFDAIWGIKQGSDYPYLKTTPFPAPKNFYKTEVTAYSISLSWDIVPGASGYEISYGDGITVISSKNSITIDGLIPNTVYIFTVRAVDGLRDSFWSITLTVKTLKEGLTASQNSEIIINAKAGETDTTALTVADIRSFENQIYTVRYDTSKLDIIDFAAQTRTFTTTPGKIKGTDIEILSHQDGEILFSVNKAIPYGKSFSGTLTLMAIKSKTTGETVIQFFQ